MSQRPYWPALDGVRAVAIAAVIAYHVGDFGGGWMGVDIFFVLSGFLITSLLLEERHATGRIRFGDFWARRARRLLPAVLLLLLVVSVYAHQRGPGLVPAQLRWPALSTLFYGANWQQMVAGHSYFAAFTAPNPLQHTWSLAIEEQYYVVWPLLFSVLLLGIRRLGTRRAIAGTAALVVMSAVWMGVAANLWGANRAYLGTDTRAWELLLGALAAQLWPPGRPTRRPQWWAGASVAGAAGVGVGMALGGGPPAWAWDGGLVGVAVCAAAVVVAVTRAPQTASTAVQAPDAPGPVAGLLRLRLMVWLGMISYSLYLWHWPVIVLLNGSSTSLDGNTLLAARLATMLAAACASYYVVERPLRRASWREWWRRGLVPVGFGVTAVAIVGSTVTPAVAHSARTVLPPAPTTTVPAVSSLPADGGTPTDPWRVWIVGDSVIADASPGVIAALDSTGNSRVVLNSSFGGWGLTTDRAWQAGSAQAIATAHPQIVIGTWAWDNGLAMHEPAVYEQLLRSYLSTLLRPGNGVDLVVLLQYPPTGPPISGIDPAKRDAQWAQNLKLENAWGREAKQAAAAFPGRALYLQTASLFAPGGGYLSWMRDVTGRWVRARKLDNAHMCPYGAAEFGALLVQELTPVLHLGPAAPGWQTGVWTHDSRYNDPPGACPDDQPPAGYRGLALPVPAGGAGQSGEPDARQAPKRAPLVSSTTPGRRAGTPGQPSSRSGRLR